MQQPGWTLRLLSEISQTEKDKNYDFTYVWNLSNNNVRTRKTHRHIDTENKLGVAAGGEWEVGKVGEQTQGVQTSSCKMDKTQGSNVQHSNYK